MKRPLRGLILSACLACAGCQGLGSWGRLTWDEDYSPLRESWEVPLGWTIPPFAIPLDLCSTLLLNLGTSWLTEDVLYAFPCTSIALTLANPECNLDVSGPPPRAAFGSLGGDEDEDAPAWKEDETVPPEERARRRRELDQAHRARERDEALQRDRDRRDELHRQPITGDSPRR